MELRLLLSKLDQLQFNDCNDFYVSNDTWKVWLELSLDHTNGKSELPVQIIIHVVFNKENIMTFGSETNDQNDMIRRWFIDAKEKVSKKRWDKRRVNVSIGKTALNDL